MRHLSAVEGKCNEIQQQRRVGCVEWLPPQKTIPLTPPALHYLWNMGLPEHDKISHSEPLYQYYIKEYVKSQIQGKQRYH